MIQEYPLVPAFPHSPPPTCKGNSNVGISFVFSTCQRTVTTLDSDGSNPLGEHVEEEADPLRKEFSHRHPITSFSPLHSSRSWSPPQTHAGLQSKFSAVEALVSSSGCVLLQLCFDDLHISPFFPPHLSLGLRSVWSRKPTVLLRRTRSVYDVWSGILEEGRGELYNLVIKGLVHFAEKAALKFEK